MLASCHSPSQVFPTPISWNVIKSMYLSVFQNCTICWQSINKVSWSNHFNSKLLSIDLKSDYRWYPLLVRNSSFECGQIDDSSVNIILQFYGVGRHTSRHFSPITKSFSFSRQAYAQQMFATFWLLLSTKMDIMLGQESDQMMVCLSDGSICQN